MEEKTELADIYCIRCKIILTKLCLSPRNTLSLLKDVLEQYEELENALEQAKNHQSTEDPRKVVGWTDQGAVTKG